MVRHKEFENVMRLRLNLKCCVAVTLFLMAASGKAQQTILPFQGVLSDQVGHVLSPASPVSLLFRLYDQPIGGTALWEEPQSNVVVQSGHFSVLLGSRNALDAKQLESTRYLGITVDDGMPLTVDLEMRPRLALVPVPVASLSLNANKLAGHDWSDLLTTGNDPSMAPLRREKVDLHFASSTFLESGGQISIRPGSIGQELLNTSILKSIADLENELASLRQALNQVSTATQAATSQLNTVRQNYGNAVSGPTASNVAGSGTIGTTSASCGPGQYVAGVDVNWSGTCNNQCSPDGGIVRSIHLICKSLF